MAHESYSSPPEMTISPDKDYYATFRTEKGPIRIKLFADKAPETVNNFVFLAREGAVPSTKSGSAGCLYGRRVPMIRGRLRKRTI
ncbi:MAG: peptidylprolyl isomerase [Actinomycetota bacterium]|nr:peptidylprolyl isomerase [Actinomycetota bacterium]